MGQMYKEQNFEEHIEEHLLKSGYLKAAPALYDRQLCIIKDEVLSFIKFTQRDEYDKLTHQYGADTDEKLCQRISSEINSRKTLDVLRKGISDRGCKFKLAYFKPSSGMNVEHHNLYRQNRFTVVRQLKYSLKNENSIDMVIFLNGLPIITMELKNSLTDQTVENAIKQYKNDRNPKGEAFLDFMRCLVHFAVGNEKVFMTTKLAGESTFFLPFNLDLENPVNPNGHKTHYLWDDILQKDTLLSLIDNYLHLQKETTKVYDEQKKSIVEKTSHTFIFPRFHQLEVTRYLLNKVKQDGVGHSYLVQHSAGSGKSNSIAWLAHQLASLYQKETDQDRLFDSVIVVTDRKVLDKQLQATIKQFEQTTGVVKPIDMNSAQLKQSLQDGKDIIITTIQKFSVIADSMTELKSNRFAVIIDEAHSSQSGESAKNLHKVLSTDLEHAEAEDNALGLDKMDVDSIVDEQIRMKGKQPNVSYFAFTATPKNKTLELFGEKKPDGSFTAHHIYSMRQAIGEGFIIDVLKNYTTFKRYFKLAHITEEDEEVAKGKAISLLTRYVDLQPHAIETKTRIMLEDFTEKRAQLIQGKARAMVITKSRLHAVKFYLMFKKIMKELNLPYKPLVAFSGTVKDPDTGSEHTENSLNGFPSNQITDALKTPEYRILIVANKFQTGFDEPLLHTMYVDKKLGGVAAVQTLSRLNRTTKGKNNTFVMDFVNEVDDILESFQPYYQTTLIEEGTEPNKLYDVKTKIEQFEVYINQDVEDFASVFYNDSVPDEKLQPILDRVVAIWMSKNADEKEDFRSLIQSYVRLYGFLSQIITFRDIDLEKLYIFLRHLNKKLPKDKTTLPTEILDAVDLDSYRIQKIYEGEIKLEGQDGKLRTPMDGVGGRKEEEKELLSQIIQELNNTYGLDLSDEHKLDLKNIQQKIYDSKELRKFMNPNNSEDAKRNKFEETMDKFILEFVNTKIDLYTKLTDNKINTVLKRKLYDAYKSVCV